MAILHRATLEPGKAELVDSWLRTRSWAGEGETRLLAAYRFDDPDGQVGVEAFLVGRGERLLHVPLTYRGAPLPGAEDALVGRTQHSVLGERWVYAAAADPVALGCFERALRGDQHQAAVEVWDGDVLVERREPAVRLRVEPGEPTAGAQLRLSDVLEPAGVDPAPGPRLLVTVPDGGIEAVVASLA